MVSFHGVRHTPATQIRVTTFHYPPKIIFEELPDGGMAYDGIEVRLVKTIAEALNASLRIATPRDGEKWGRRKPDGDYSGEPDHGRWGLLK